MYKYIYILNTCIIANNYVKLESTIKRTKYNDVNHSNEMWRHSALESRLVTVTRGSNGKVAKALGFVSPSCENGNHGNTGKHWMHLNAKCDTTWFDPNRVYPLNGLFMVGVLETSISLQYACFKNGSPISNTLQCIMMSYDVLCLFFYKFEFIFVYVCTSMHWIHVPTVNESPLTLCFLLLRLRHPQSLLPFLPFPRFPSRSRMYMSVD